MPTAVIQRHGPSIRQPETLAAATRNVNRPNLTVTISGLTSTHAFSRVTPKTARSAGADQRPMRIGYRTDLADLRWFQAERAEGGHAPGQLPRLQEAPQVLA